MWPAAKQCEGKAGFGTYVHAKRVYDRMRHSYEGTPLQAYHCPHCNEWHIGERLAARKYGRRPRPKVRQLSRAELEAA